jgi:aspartate/methionine/tyrosine aminotransferase
MLTHVSDAFLPVNDHAQCAVPGIFARGADVPRMLRERARHGRDLALAALSVPGVTSIVPPRAGLFLTMRLLAEGLHEEAVALDLLQRARVLVHPGYFYDLPPDHIVLAYAVPPDVLRSALGRVAARLSDSGGRRGGARTSMMGDLCSPDPP